MGIPYWRKISAQEKLIQKFIFGYLYYNYNILHRILSYSGPSNWRLSLNTGVPESEKLAP